jgi:hypothetical protein
MFLRLRLFVPISAALSTLMPNGKASSGAPSRSTLHWTAFRVVDGTVSAEAWVTDTLCSSDMRTFIY